MNKATYPIEDRGVLCMDCEREINAGQPYAQRLSYISPAHSVPVVEVVCVYCFLMPEEDEE